MTRPLAAILLVLAIHAPTRAESGRIRFRAGAQTTTFATPAVAAETLLNLALRDAASAGRAVLQFDRPVENETRAQLQAAGVTLQTYLGDYAYIARLRHHRLDPAALAKIDSLRVTLPLYVEWKLHPSLLRGEIVPWSIIPDDDNVTPADNPTVACYVQFHPDVSLDTTAVAVANRHAARIRSQMRSINALVLELPYANIASLAAADEVLWIEPPLPPLSECNNSNRARTDADLAQELPYELDGAGVSVMVYDGGSVLTTHPDFGGRATVRDGSDLSDHATHVAGTIGGDGTASGGAYRGMAPAVTIESYEFETDGPLEPGFLYTDPGDIEQDYNDALNNWGATLSNNSIGSNVARNGFPCEWTGDYGPTSALLDAIVRGSLGQPFRVIYANGNERSTPRCGDTYYTTSPPAGAKNHITVGALNSNDDSVTSFTSWGPVDDGRMKPDLSAPGCQSDDDQGVTSCSSAGAYNTKCGTSMACPTFTGLAALLIQDYRAHYPGQPDFRNSTLKALFAHTAEDIVAIGPDYQSGYGSVRIVPAIEQMRANNWLEATLDQGDLHQSLIVVEAGTPELKVTLAWDDYPGATLVSPALVNDLDLRVIDPADGVHYPWTLDPANPAAPAVQVEPDRLNNIEQVVLDAPLPGVYTIEIVGFNIPQGPQPFSLVASPVLINCTPAGTLKLDRFAYACESALTVALNDCDLNTDNALVEFVLLPVTSDTEPTGEDMLLTETGPETAQFVGTLALSTIDAVGTLQVTAGDTLIVTYIDADDGQGGLEVVVEATAPVDCTAPVVSGVTATDLGPRSARILFDTDEPATVIVHYGLSCAALTESADALGYRLDHSVALLDLVDNTTYFYALEVVDYAGNVTFDDDGGACYSFTTTDVPNYFTEQFYTDFDLAYRILEFTPDGSVDFYHACSYATLVLPNDPAGGFPLNFSSVSSHTINLAAGAQVWLYGAPYSTMYVNAHGNITLDNGDSDSTESYTDHFDNLRVAALFDDLNPAIRGTVSWRQHDDRVVVTWEDVTEDNEYNSNTFQIALFFDGRIQLTWLGIDATDGLVGLSQGLDVPADFLPSDLTLLVPCGPQPPSAADVAAAVGQDRATTISLNALDDGLPAPPGALSYVITSLPAFELRDAANDELIQEANLPYTLLDGGHQVIYASAGYIGPDTFTYLADDGGSPPDAGPSNEATVNIQVNPVLTLPFFDAFPQTTFDAGKWVDVFNATIDDVGLTLPSPPYALRLNGQPVGVDTLTSHLIDLSNEPAVRLSYAWQRTGGGESPDSGDNLIVEHRRADGTWALVAEYAGDGPDMTFFATEVLFLSETALHNSFQLRFHATGTPDSDPLDDWFIDDISLSLADAPLAFSQALTVPVDGFRDITLAATDPTGDPLDTIIVLLPDHGTLTDPVYGLITPEDLPHTLAAGGNVVRYTPQPAYMGPDLFKFLASDGIHDSNLATVTLSVEPILTLPFFDDFPGTTFAVLKWSRTDGATIDNVGLEEPSPPYAARLNGSPSGGDLLRTFALDLSEISPVRLQYYWQRTGGGDSPENGEDLFVEYLDESGVWQILSRHEGAGDDMTSFALADVLLPDPALHAEFRLRFRNSSGSTTGDDWFVDDILLFLPLTPEAYDQSQTIAKFSYTTLALLAIDPNGDPLTYFIESLPASGTLYDVGHDHAITADDLPYALVDGGNTLMYDPPLGFTGGVSFTFHATDGVQVSNSATVSVSVVAPQFTYFYPLNVDPGWSTEGEWEFGIPLGQYNDPIAGFTGSTIYGYDLAGRYDNNIPPYYLTTTAIDCARLTNVQLEFYRWLGVEWYFFDHANIQVSNDGAAWATVWEHAGPTLSETAWSFQSYPLGTTADRQPTVYLRWGMGPTDGGVTYQGWNLDDISIVGDLQPDAGDLDGDGDVDAIDQRGFEICLFGADTLPDPPDPMTSADCLDAFDFDTDGDVDCDDWDALITVWTGPPAIPEPVTACGLPGDLNCDGLVDFNDINPFVLALSNPAAYAQAYPDCDAGLGDINNDGVFDFKDINPFVLLLSSP